MLLQGRHPSLALHRVQALFVLAAPELSVVVGVLLGELYFGGVPRFERIVHVLQGFVLRLRHALHLVMLQLLLQFLVILLESCYLSVSALDLFLQLCYFGLHVLLALFVILTQLGIIVL